MGIGYIQNQDEIIRILEYSPNSNLSSCQDGDTCHCAKTKNNRKPSYIIEKPDGTFARRYYADFGRHYEVVIQPEGAMMENQEEYEAEMIQSGNAAAESLSQAAAAAGHYLKELRKSGIQYDLACEMVKEWHRIQWESVFLDSRE